MNWMAEHWMNGKAKTIFEIMNNLVLQLPNYRIYRIDREETDPSKHQV